MQLQRRTMLGTLGAIAWTLPWSQAGRRAVADDNPSKPRGPAIRIGQIGVGHAHATKLSAYRNSNDYEVVGIVETDPALREAARQQPAFRDLPWMTEEQLLNQPGLQAVLVETHVRDSLAAAQRCIAAGKHVHLDKPAGASLPEYTRLLKQAEQQQLMVQMGYMYRYNPAVLLLREFLKQGWLGEVFEVHTVMSKVVDTNSRQQLAEFSGGMMFELGCHIIDLVVGVLGAPTQVTPYAQHAASENDNLMDNMLAVFEYRNALATVKTSAMEVEGFARRHFVVCGTEGTFHIQPLDNPGARVALARKQGTYQAGYQDLTFPKFVRYVADAADMAQVIRQERECQFSYSHDLNVQKAVLEASRMSIGS
jgi:predicted dehydrogenase